MSKTKTNKQVLPVELFQKDGPVSGTHLSGRAQLAAAICFYIVCGFEEEDSHENLHLSFVLSDGKAFCLTLIVFLEVDIYVSVNNISPAQNSACGGPVRFCLPHHKRLDPSSAAA